MCVLYCVVYVQDVHKLHHQQQQVIIHSNFVLSSWMFFCPSFPWSNCLFSSGWNVFIHQRKNFESTTYVIKNNLFEIIFIIIFNLIDLRSNNVHPVTDLKNLALLSCSCFKIQASSTRTHRLFKLFIPKQQERYSTQTPEMSH